MPINKTRGDHETMNQTHDRQQKSDGNNIDKFALHLHHGQCLRFDFVNFLVQIWMVHKHHMLLISEQN